MPKYLFGSLTAAVLWLTLSGCGNNKPAPTEKPPPPLITFKSASEILNYYEAALKRGNPIDALFVYDRDSLSMTVWSGETTQDGKPSTPSRLSGSDASKFVEETVLRVNGEVVVHAKSVTEGVSVDGESVAYAVLVWSAKAAGVAYYAELMRITEKIDGTFVAEEVAVHRQPFSETSSAASRQASASLPGEERRQGEQQGLVTNPVASSCIGNENAYGCLFLDALRDNAKADTGKMADWFAEGAFVIYYDHSSRQVLTATNEAQVRSLYGAFYALEDKMTGETWQDNVISLPPYVDDMVVVTDKDVQIWNTMETRRSTQPFQALNGLPKQFQFITRFDPNSLPSEELLSV